MPSEFSVSITLDLIANLSSIVSLVTSALTLFVSFRIKASVLKQVEKNDYLRDIDTQLVELSAVYEALADDQTPFDETYINLAVRTLEVFPIRYDKILPKRIMNEVNSLIEYFNKDYRKDIYSRKARRDASSKLHQMILKLEKEKKIL